MKLTLSNLDQVYHCKMVSVETMQYKGYELIKELFVDSSGLGADDEPALTQSQFMRELTEIINDNGGMVYASITNAGQFQVYIGLFKRSNNKRSRKIDNNTLEILDDDGNREAIRLHDTNILTWKHDYIVLDNGGYYTRTTKDRLNKYLPMGVYVYQKNYEWYVSDSRDNTIKLFTNGMKIAN